MRYVYPPDVQVPIADGCILAVCSSCRLHYPTPFVPKPDGSVAIYLLACGGAGGVHVFETEKPPVERYDHSADWRERNRHTDRCRTKSGRKRRRGCRRGGFHHHPLTITATFAGDERMRSSYA